MKEKEIWKALEIYNGEYAISNLGRVMSLKNGIKRICNPCVGSSGYPQVTIRFKKKQHTKAVHRLMAVAFGMAADGLEINHIDGNKCNNNLKNLEICTRSQNMKHAYKIGLITRASVINPLVKINMEIANEIRKDVSVGKTYAEVSRKYKISQTQVSRIVNNKRWIVKADNAPIP